jgi:hypothetical protein
VQENSDNSVIGVAGCVTGSVPGICKNVGETDCK